MRGVGMLGLAMDMHTRMHMHMHTHTRMGTRMGMRTWTSRNMMSMGRTR